MMMRIASMLVSAIMASAALVIVTDESAGQDKKVDKINHAILIQELHSINVALSKANPVYAGHRGKGMHQIHEAIIALEEHNKTKKENRKKKPAENKQKSLPQVQSDAILTTAIGSLAKVQGQLLTLSNIPPHARASKHIDHAVIELEKALKFASQLVSHRGTETQRREDRREEEERRGFPFFSPSLCLCG